MRTLFLVICLCQVLCFTSKNAVCMEAACERWVREDERKRAMTPRTRAVYDAEQATLRKEQQAASQRNHIEWMRVQVAAYDARQHPKDRSGSGDSSGNEYHSNGLTSDVSPGLKPTTRDLDMSPPPEIYLPHTAQNGTTSPFYAGDSNRVVSSQRGLADDGSEADDESDTGSSVGVRHREKKSTTRPPSTTRAGN